MQAFNTILFATMSTAEPVGTCRVLFVAGDDVATSTVANLIRDVWLHLIVLGPLATAERLGGIEVFTPVKDAVAS